MKIKYFKKINRKGNENEYAKFDNVIFRNNGKYYIAYKNDKKYKNLHQAVYMLNNNLSEIPKGYDIHHKDFNKSNNNISNLQLLTRSEHTKIHNKLKNNSKENNPMFGKKQSKKSNKSNSEKHIGKNNPRYIKFTKEQIDFLVNLRKDGIPKYKLHIHFNIAFNTKLGLFSINRVLKENNID